MDHHFEIEKKAKKENLKDILTFVRDNCINSNIDSSICSDMRLVVEEICVNLIDHAYEGTEPGPIRLKLQIDETRIFIHIFDFASPFDPEAAPEPDIEANWEDRKIGGLGWFFVHQIMDDIRYKPNTNEGNVLTLIKRLDSEKKE